MACIRKRKNKWVVDYRVGLVRRTPSFDTKAEAEIFKRELLLRPLDQQTGYKKIIDISLAEATQKYLETITPKKAPGSQLLDRLVLGRPNVQFANRFVWEITLQDLELYQLQLLRGRGGATINRNFGVIKNFFRKCVEWNYLRESPTIHLKKLAEAPKRKTLMSPEQVSQLIAALPDWASNVVYFIARTGVRRGEACDLKWSDVNFRDRFVTVKSIRVALFATGIFRLLVSSSIF